MTMSDGALDLSITSYEVQAQRVLRPTDNGSSDSGRASTDSMSSEVHDDIKVRHHSPANVAPVSLRMGGASSGSGSVAGVPVFPPVHFRDFSELPSQLQHPISSSISPSRHSQTSTYSNPTSPVSEVTNTADEDTKPSIVGERISDPRIGPIRPFKMYPIDPFNVYGNPLLAGAGGTLSPTPVGIQSLYDASSPSGFPTFPLTPLTSHLLHRKRRAENRENSSTNASSTSTSSSAVNSSSPSHPGCSSNNNSAGNGSSNVSTSSPQSPKEDSNSSEGEKRTKTSSSIEVKKDDAYWDRRRKNNEAAKRSRDARRQKEEEIAMRAAFLEQENLKLRAQVAILKNETAKLHYMLYNRI